MKLHSGWQTMAKPLVPEGFWCRSRRRRRRSAAARVGFTYAVLAEPGGDVVGCVSYPARDGRHDCEMRSWVSARRADLDRPVHETVVRWLERDWPFAAVLAHERP